MVSLNFLLTASLAFLQFCVSVKQPNIILILADDLGFNDLSFRGSNEIPTPNIDALAYNGRILNRHYVLPICTPSRSALLTGMDPIRLGTQGFPMKGGQPGGIPLSRQILPQYLKELGYKTHLTGKWHVGYTSLDYLPTNRGFDSFLGYYNGYCDYYRLDLNQTLSDGQTVFSGFDMHDNLQTRWDLQGQYATDIFTNRAIEIINSHDNDKPLFLFVSHLAAHTGTDDDGDGLQVPSDIDPDYFSYIPLKERRNYAAIVQSLDKSVGKIVGKLAERKMLQDSIILFLADNGAASVASDMLPNFGSNWPLRGGGVRGAAILWSFNLSGGIIDDQMYHITDWVDLFKLFAGGKSANQDIKKIYENLINNNTKTHPRDFLINLDELSNSEAVLLESRYKIVKQNLRKYGNYDYHFKVELDKNVPDMTIDMIENSDVGQALQGLGISMNADSIDELRRKTIVNCKPHNVHKMGNVASSTDFFCKDYCLFDIIQDPCELTPLFKPEIMKRGKKLLETYRENIVPQNTYPVDESSNPEFFGGVWTPWLDNLPHNEFLINSGPAHCLCIFLILILTLPRIFKFL